MPRGSESTFRRGRQGEERACAFLQSVGFRILRRNFRCRLGEIDIVAEDSGVLVFVEVKSWSSLGPEELEHSINIRKQRRIIAASRFFLARFGAAEDAGVRYDVVYLRGDSDEIHHVPSAFTERT